MELMEMSDHDLMQKQIIEDLPELFINNCNLKEYQVVCEESAKQALSYSLKSKKLKNQIEISRKRISKPHLDFQKAVKKFSDDLIVKLEEIELKLSCKVFDWIKLSRENPFTCFEELQVEDGKLTTKKTWEFEILDEEQIPEDYLHKKIDMKKIEIDVKSGIRNIPGVNIFCSEKAVLKIKN